MIRVLTILIFSASFSGLTLGQDLKEAQPSNNELSIDFGDPLPGLGPALGLESYQSELLDIHASNPLAASEVLRRLSDSKSPFAAFKEFLLSQKNDPSDLNPLVLANTLLHGYAELPKPLGYQADEISKTAFHCSRIFSELNYARTVNVDDLANAYIPNRLFPADENTPGQTSVEQFRKRIAQDHLSRARLLAGLGADDLAISGMQEAVQWGSQVPENWRGAIVTDDQGSGHVVLDSDLNTIRHLLERGKLKEVFPLLSGIIARSPDNKDALKLMIEWLQHEELHATYFPESDPPETYERAKALRRDWDSLASARTRLLIACHTRLLIAGDESHRRSRAELFQTIGLYNLSLLDTTKLTNAARPTAQDWVLHARAIAATSTLETEEECHAASIKACKQAVEIDPDRFQTLVQLVGLYTLQLESSNTNAIRTKRIKQANVVLSQLEKLVGNDPGKEISFLLSKGELLKQQAEYSNLDAPDSFHFEESTEAFRLLMKAKECYSRCLVLTRENQLGGMQTVERTLAEIDQAISSPESRLPTAIDLPSDE